MPDLHSVVQKLVLKLLDVEDLLEQVIELLLAHHFVAQHGGGESLATPPRLVVWSRGRSPHCPQLSPLVMASYLAIQLVSTVSLLRPSISGRVRIRCKK